MIVVRSLTVCSIVRCSPARPWARASRPAAPRRFPAPRLPCGPSQARARHAPSGAAAPRLRLARISLFGRPRGRSSAASDPRSRSRRHSVNNDEYKPSRDSNAPISPGLADSAASRRIRSLYCAVNLRRRARSTISGSGGGTATSCARSVPLRARSREPIAAPSFVFSGVPADSSSRPQTQ